MVKTKSSNPDVIPRENPFRAIAKMAKTSVGRLPAHLVIIFFVALGITVLFGVAFQFSEKHAARNNAYLAERLSPDSSKPAVTESQLTGIWVTAKDGTTVTLRIGSGVFEIVARYKGVPTTRNFIRGGYKIDGNVIVMQERKDLGTPIDPLHYEYRFYPLAIKNINIYADISDARMIWTTPERELARLENPEAVTRLIFGGATAWIKIAAIP